MFFKFEKNDLFYNQIKCHPNVNFKIYNRSVYYNDIPRIGGTNVSNVGNIPTGYMDLYENNVDRASTNLIRPFISKQSLLAGFKTISVSTFNSGWNYGDIISGSYPMTATIAIDRWQTNVSRSYIDSLHNALDRYQMHSPHYAYSSSFGDKSEQEIKIIDIPSIFYGSSIKKGSVSCKYFLTGVLAAELVDDKGNGELRQRLPGGAQSSSIAGVVLYKEGIMILTSSWSIHSSHTENFDVYNSSDLISPSWLHFGTTGSAGNLTNVASSSFELDFQGTTYVPVCTMFAHAPRGMLNFSNNPTFPKYGQTGSNIPLSNSVQYIEKNDIQIKNIVRSPYIEPTGTFQKITFISRVNIYDDKKNLIAIANVANPIRKTESDNYTFKLKLDI